MVKNFIVISVIFGVLLPSFAFIPRPNLLWGLAQDQSISPPTTLEEAKEVGERTFKGAIEFLPKTVERIWKEEVLPIWQGMYNWAKKTFWDPYILPIFKKIESIFKKEVEKRKEIIEQRIEEEKKKLKERIKKEKRGLIERIIPETLN